MRRLLPKATIQPVLNQGARKEDIAASIFKAVVDQTITGLAQGRRITGKVLFLGGPLYYFKGLQREFVRSLGLSHENAVFPDMGRYAVALGSALFAEKTGQPMTYEELVGRARGRGQRKPRGALPRAALRERGRLRGVFEPPREGVGSAAPTSTPTRGTPTSASTAAARRPSSC